MKFNCDRKHLQNTVVVLSKCTIYKCIVLFLVFYRGSAVIMSCSWIHTTCIMCWYTHRPPSFDLEQSLYILFISLSGWQSSCLVCLTADKIHIIHSELTVWT